MILSILISLLAVLIMVIVIFYIIQEKLIFYPDAIPPDYTYSFDTDFEELFLDSGNAKINALHFKIPQSKGVILYFHGNAGSLNSWGELGKDFIKTGYDFFIFDYRGYGKSLGPQSEAAFHADGQMVYDYLKKQYNEKQIVIYGRSLGSGFATKLALNNTSKCLILETPYYNFTSVGKHHFSYLPISLILRWTIRTDQWIGNVKVPILIFHGTHDEVIPYRKSIKLKKFLKAEDTFVTIQTATHNNIPTYPEYEMYLKKYLE